MSILPIGSRDELEHRDPPVYYPNDVVFLTFESDHPALQNGGFATVMRISPDEKNLWVKPSVHSAIYQVPTTSATPTSDRGPLPHATVSATRNRQSERD